VDIETKCLYMYLCEIKVNYIEHTKEKMINLIILLYFPFPNIS